MFLFEADLENEQKCLSKRLSLACNSHVADKVKASKFFVFLTLLYRTTIDQLRDKEFKAKCIQHLITALIIGAIFIRIPWNQHVNPYLKKVRPNFSSGVVLKLESFFQVLHDNNFRMSSISMARFWYWLFSFPSPLCTWWFTNSRRWKIYYDVSTITACIQST